MKTITMELYLCEICQKQFDTANLALDCESSHTGIDIAHFSIIGTEPGRIKKMGESIDPKYQWPLKFIVKSELYDFSAVYKFLQFHQ